MRRRKKHVTHKRMPLQGVRLFFCEKMLRSYRHTFIACCGGYIAQAVVNNFAPLLFVLFQTEFSLALDQITLLITVNFAIQLMMDLLSAKFVDKIGYRTCVVAAHVMAAMGLAFLAFLPDVMGNAFAALLICVVLYAMGGGLIEVIISPIVEACPAKNKAARMSLLHSFYCWGAAAVVLLSTAFFSFAGQGNWRILAAVWALFPVLNGLYFCFVPIVALTEPGEGMSVRKLASGGLFWVCMLLMFAAGASELAMSQWASAFAESGLGVSKAMGDLMGPCLFAICMGLSRVLTAPLSRRFSLPALMGISGVLCITAYLLAGLAAEPLWALVGCGLCGFSVGIMWPGTYSIASARIPLGGTALFALLALAGDAGCSLGPTLVGFAAELCGDSLKAGMLVGTLFPALLLLSLVLLRIFRRKGGEQAPQA